MASILQNKTSGSNTMIQKYIIKFILGFENKCGNLNDCPVSQKENMKFSNNLHAFTKARALYCIHLPKYFQMYDLIICKQHILGKKL